MSKKIFFCLVFFFSSIAVLPVYGQHTKRRAGKALKINDSVKRRLSVLADSVFRKQAKGDTAHQKKDSAANTAAADNQPGIHRNKKKGLPVLWMGVGAFLLVLLFVITGRKKKNKG